MLQKTDNCGESALLLAESTLHALVARGALTTAEALDALDNAIDIQLVLQEERADGGAPPRELRLCDMRDSMAMDAD